MIKVGDALAVAPVARPAGPLAQATPTRRGLAPPASVGPESAPTVMHLPAVGAPGVSGHSGGGRWRRALGVAAIAAAAVAIALLAFGRSTSGVAGDARVPESTEAGASAAAVAAPGATPGSVPEPTASDPTPAKGAPSAVASSVPSASSRPAPPGGKLARPPAVAVDAGPARARPTTFDDPG